MADQVIRTLDEDAVAPSDRLRLIAMYVLYRDGILPADLEKLLLHAQLPLQDGAVVSNLDMLGARVARGLKEKREPPMPLFPRKPIQPDAEEYSLSRYEPVLKDVLEEHVLGRLPQDIFPYTKGSPDEPGMDATPAASLRSAKPTWAKSKLSSVEPRQRIIVFMAGGATYSEARACYEISEKTSRDVFLVTSHMINPGLYLRQIGDLSQTRRNLRLPADLPPPKAPAHLFEKPEPPKPAPPPANAKPGVAPGRPNIPGGLPSRPGGHAAPPTAGMANMSLNSRPQGTPTPPPSGGKYGKEEKEKKKKHHFFGKSKS